MRWGVVDRHFKGFPQAILYGGRGGGGARGDGPPPGSAGNCLPIHGIWLAQELLDGRVPVRVRIAPARCLTGWTWDGWDCPGGLG